MNIPDLTFYLIYLFAVCIIFNFANCIDRFLNVVCTNLLFCFYFPLESEAIGHDARGFFFHTLHLSYDFLVMEMHLTQFISLQLNNLVFFVPYVDS